MWRIKLNRRTFLTAVGSAVLITSAGCTEDTSQKEEKFKYREFLKELESRKYKYGYKDKLGMHIYKWADLVRDTWNELHPDDPIITYRVKLGTEQFKRVLNKWYSIHTGYKGNDAYNEDKADWVLDKNEFGTLTYWHSIRITKKKNKYVVDNYYQGKDWQEDDNVYEINDIKQLVDNWVYFDYGYIYIFENDIMNQHEKDIRTVRQAMKGGITKNPNNIEDVEKGNYTVDVRIILIVMRAIKLVLKLLGKSVKDLFKL